MSKRDDGAGITLTALAIGSVFIAMKWGAAAGIGVFCCLFAIGSEIQRKANEVLDAIEDKRR